MASPDDPMVCSCNPRGARRVCGCVGISPRDSIYRGSDSKNMKLVAAKWLPNGQSRYVKLTVMLLTQTCQAAAQLPRSHQIMAYLPNRAAKLAYSEPVSTVQGCQTASR